MKKMLEHLKVLDFTTNVAGPSGSGLLADFGANVIKIERPGTGDDNRSFPPMVEKHGMIGLWNNRNKKSVTLNLADPDGQRIAKQLMADCDVVLESYRPGIMDKFGLGYEAAKQIKPDIIYCSVSAYGVRGPDAKKPGYDLIAQAVSGLMDLNGEPNGPPMKSGLTLGDYWQGIAYSGYLLMAYYHKLKTGEGQFIDASLLQNMIFHNPAILELNTGRMATRNGNDHPYYAPYSAFCGKDRKYAVICVTTDAAWKSLCGLMHAPSTWADMNNEQRLSARGQVAQQIELWLGRFDEIEDAVAQMSALGIPSCKVNTMLDIWNMSELQEKEWLVECELQDDISSMRTWITRNTPVTMEKTPGRCGKSPVLGQHNQEILGAIMGQAELDALLTKFATVSAH